MLACQDTSEPIFGSVRAKERRFLRDTPLSGLIQIKMPSHANGAQGIIDIGSPISGFVFIDEHNRITGRIYVKHLGPVWGKPIRDNLSKNESLIFLVNLKMLRPYDDLFLSLYRKLPSSLVGGLLRPFITLIRDRVIHYRPQFSLDEIPDPIPICVKSEKVSTMKRVRKDRIKTSTYSWVKVADGTYVDRTPRNQRLKCIRDAMKEAEDILQSAQHQGDQEAS